MSIKSNLIKAAGLGVVVSALSAGAAFAAVATSSVNVRTGPGTGYHVVDQLHPGEFVSVTGRSNGWCKVQKSGPDGWVSCSYLAGGGFDRGVRPPSVSFSFGFGGPHVYVGSPPHHHYPSHPYHPWWW